MPGDGFGEEWQFREILKITDDPQRRPALVHCARGTCRTGAAVAIYRFERDGWTLEDVATEMRRQTYHYGWLPGYVYAMAKNKPALAGPRPEMVFDHNQMADLSPDVSDRLAKEAEHEPLIRPSSGRPVGSNSRRLRPDGASDWTTPQVKVAGARLIMVGLALFFVILGAINLDLGPAEARLGLAAGEKLGPLGQVFGYWAPELWPAQVIPSLVLGRLEAFGRPSSAAVRWPAALAGIIAGWMIARSMAKALGLRAGVLFGICWFGSLALIDRSSATGLDLIVGLATLASIDRLITPWLRPRLPDCGRPWRFWPAAGRPWS